MPISYVGGDINESSSFTVPESLSLTLPTHQADDFGIIYAFADAGSTVPVLSVVTASGWTTLVDNEEHTPGRDRVNFVAYKKFTSSSETNPSVQIATISEEMQCAVLVFRGVDPTNPFDVTYTSNSGADNETPTPQPITTESPNCAIVLLNGQNDNDHNAAGAPAGYTLGPSDMRSNLTNRNIATAYNLDAGAAGLKSPGAWTHDADGVNTSDYSNYTIALALETVATGPDHPFTSITVTG